MGGGCFAGDGAVAMDERGERTVRVDELQPGDHVFSPVLGRNVEILATTRSLESRVCTVNRLRISRKHPIKMEPGAEWVFPMNVAKSGVELLSTPLLVHNFVLAEGGAMRVNGMDVITLGDNEAAGMGAHEVHAYYGTSRVVKELKALPSWPACEWGMDVSFAA